MFDKLVASEPKSADFKNRSRYFVTSSVIVGVLFLAAVVASIFAAEYGIGDSGFEIAQILQPADLAPVEQEPPSPRNSSLPSALQSSVPIRRTNMASVNEPTVAPDSISTSPNTDIARPDTGRFNTGPINSNAGTAGGNQSGSGRGGRPAGPGVGLEQSKTDDLPEETPPREIIKPRPPVSKGPLNGYAKSLPKPVYTAAAKAVRAQGSVMVQVIIDERGNVISATAMKGHPMLIAEAEKAARNAKFSPTTLGDVPVKVTGVITYNFIL